MNRLYLFFVTTITTFFLYYPSFGQTPFVDDFESYIVGQQLACQNPIDWTTWSNSPCDVIEDPYISTSHAYSGTRSVVIVQNNDLVKPLGNLTSGLRNIDFMVYISTGKSGYFNTLAIFNPPSTFDWAMECYFDVGGGGRLLGVPGAPISFSYPVDSWFRVSVIVDLDATPSQGQLWVNNVQVGSAWDWTQGGIIADQLAANDFFGAATTDEMYIDDFEFDYNWFHYPPIAPSNLTTQLIYNPNPQVKLNWQDNSWNENAFNIIKKNGSLSDSTSFELIGSVYSNTTEFIDAYVISDSTYTYGVIAYNAYGYSDTSNFATITIDSVTNVFNIKEPLTYFLKQNYPNPFNPSTKIEYSMPEAGFVKLSVYNLLGEEVAVLFDGETEAGFHEVTFYASSMPSGTYFYKLQTQNTFEVKKMLLTK